jgi:hypothetical protein
VDCCCFLCGALLFCFEVLPVLAAAWLLVGFFLGVSVEVLACTGWVRGATCPDSLGLALLLLLLGVFAGPTGCSKFGYVSAGGGSALVDGLLVLEGVERPALIWAGLMRPLMPPLSLVVVLIAGLL